MMPMLIGLAAAAVLAGTMLTVVGLVGTTRPATRTSTLRRRLVGLLTGEGLSDRQRRNRRIMTVTAAAVAVAAWLITGIPMAGIIAGLTVVGLPWLFGAGRAEQQAIARMAALEIWTRRLTDMVRTGLGLNQAIYVSVRDAPPAIATELHELEVQMRAGVPALTALSRLADALGDASSDEVIVPLMLHATDRGQRLADILDKLSDGIAREITMRRELWATRADPRLTARVMTVLAVVVLAALFTNPTYIRPYSTVLGQSVLAVCMAVFIALLVWVRRLSAPRRVPRLIATTAPAGRE